MQAYSIAAREADPHSLPDIEVFHSSEHLPDHQPTCSRKYRFSCDCPSRAAGFYWWPCFPGCLPDGDPAGPFATSALALVDARSDGGA